MGPFCCAVRPKSIKLEELKELSESFSFYSPRQMSMKFELINWPGINKLEQQCTATVPN